MCVQISSLAGPLCRPPSLPNYDLADPKLFYTAGTVVTLRCAKGYQLAGSGIVKCEESGTWFPHLPNCEPQLVPGTPDPTDRGQGNTSLLPGAGPGNRLQRKCYSGCMGVIYTTCIASAIYNRAVYRQCNKYLCMPWVLSINMLDSSDNLLTLQLLCRLQHFVLQELDAWSVCSPGASTDYSDQWCLPLQVKASVLGSWLAWQYAYYWQWLWWCYYCCSFGGALVSVTRCTACTVEVAISSFQCVCTYTSALLVTVMTDDFGEI